jgi:hypothetical protein
MHLLKIEHPSMYRYDADDLETMASGIVVAIMKYSIPINQLTDQEIWEELQKNGYKFPERQIG